MISYLKGNILWKDSDYIILQTNGVGYKVFVPENVYAQCKEGQEHFEIFCSLQVRKEETIELYGVASFEALKLFEVFRDVSGIGPKAAMVLASLGKPEDIKRAVDEQNTSYFSGIKGIGHKKVQKIILDLTGKLGGFEGAKRQKGNGLVDSLISLGFSKAESQEALEQVPEGVDDEQKVTEALKFLGRR
jgi:holliday junction DNA helicase RuvA